MYGEALTKEFTAEHIKKINAFIITFRETYLKAIRLMRENRLSLQKFVDPLTKKSDINIQCCRFIGVYM
ncbi:hypothetical protein GCM10023260_03850 [Bartonella acomydis]|uniref:Uncharacterized protein n=1 Tax=Bartonella acomydis TaxID=686234 RepID=A0ABP9MF53_9HYPH